MADGSRSERRFYRAELQRIDKHHEYAKMFGVYLNKERVISGEAKKDAEKQHQGERAKMKARKAIPGVWHKLMTAPDEMLRDVLVEAVESECGTKPTLDDVESFLQEEIRPPAPVFAPNPKPVVKTVTPSPGGSKRIVGFILDGQEVRVGVGNRVLAEVLKEFQKRDPNFLPQFAQVTVGRTRRLVAQTREGLYDQADLADFSVDLENGWWLGTNLSLHGVRKNIEIACRIAGVKFGSQLTLIS